jgi:hypothetical protein
VLLERSDLLIDQRDTEGFTALFHACNHGKYRVGDQHGYFRRLWSWDLRQAFSSFFFFFKFLLLSNIKAVFGTFF